MLLLTTYVTAQQSGNPSLNPRQKDKTVRPERPNCRNALGGIVTRRGLENTNNPRINAGMRGIPIKLLDVSGNQVAETLTDRDGRYGFQGLCPGTYTICPGIPCPAGGRIPSRYSPPSIEARVPPMVQNGLNFSFLEPTHRKPREYPRANGNN